MTWLSFVLLCALQGPAGEEAEAALQRLTAEGRWAEAATQAEVLLAADGADGRRALAAGTLRAAAGHHAHAWRHFDRYLGLQGLSAEDREAAEQRRGNLIASTRVVALQVSPEVPARVVARRVGEEGLPALESAVVGGKASVRIDLGTWELRVEAPGYAPLVRTIGGDDVVRLLRFTLDPMGPTPQPGPTRAPPEPVRTRAPVALVAGAVVLPLGLAALAGTLAVVPGYRRSEAALDAWQAEIAGGPVSLDELRELQALGGTARRQEGAMIGLGVAAGALITVGAILVGRGRGELRRRRLQLEARPGAVAFGLSGRF